MPRSQSLHLPTFPTAPGCGKPPESKPRPVITFSITTNTTSTKIIVAIILSTIFMPISITITIAFKLLLRLLLLFLYTIVPPVPQNQHPATQQSRGVPPPLLARSLTAPVSKSKRAISTWPFTFWELPKN